MTAPKPRGRGRPPTDGPRVAVRLTVVQAKALERVAKAAGVPLSTYMREAALQKAGLAALGIAGEAARIRAALSPTVMDRVEQVRRETGRMPDDAR